MDFSISVTFCALSTHWGSKWGFPWQIQSHETHVSYQVISSDFWWLFTWHQISWDGCYTRCKRAKYVYQVHLPLSLSVCVVCVCAPQVWQQQPWLKLWNSRKWNWWPWTTFTEARTGPSQRTRRWNSSAGQSHTYKDTLKVHWIILLLLTEEVWLKVDVFSISCKRFLIIWKLLFKTLPLIYIFSF